MTMLQAQPIPYSTHNINSRQITVKRLDLVHPRVSGNKFFKLKYNLKYVIQNNIKTVISFGGAYSNHIYALAQACHECGIESIGYIRGEELADKPLNSNLQQAQDLGMQLEFISRSTYRIKHTQDFLATLAAQHNNAYIIPEGGSNQLAIKGTSEILTVDDVQKSDVIVCAVGTGGTITGIINASNSDQIIIGISALNSNYQENYINKHANKSNWHIFADTEFGGYSKYNETLIDYINELKIEQQLELEPIYTGKAFYRMFAIMDELKIEKSARVLFIHTGGMHHYKQTKPS